jgi:hemoglobin-like flavoprotein
VYVWNFCDLLPHHLSADNPHPSSVKPQTPTMGCNSSKRIAPYKYIDDITLTEGQLQAVINSWQLVKAFGSEKIGSIIFLKIFIVAPETFKMFRFQDDPDWEHSRMFRHHCKIVVNIIGASVKNLRKPELMIKHLDELGLKHSFFPITPEHFDILGTEILVAFEKVIGFMFTKEAREGWIKVYDIMSRAIQLAMTNFRKENKLDVFLQVAKDKGDEEDRERLSKLTPQPNTSDDVASSSNV